MTENTINKIMQTINENKVKPKSKIYFAVIFAELIIVTLSVFLLCSFFINTVFYSYHNYRYSFGNLNNMLPWPALLLIIFAYSLGIYLLRKFEVSYTKSFTLIALTVTGAVLFAGYLLSTTSLNSNLLKYRGYKRMYMMTLQEEDWIQGILISKNNQEYTINDSNGNTHIVNFNNQTQQPYRELETGDCLRVAGTLNGNIMQAKGISRCGNGKGNGGGMGQGMMRNR